MADGVARYEVEVESLADFHAFMGREAAENLDPGARGIRVDLSHGNHWGRSLHASAVDAARLAYLDAHFQADTNLDGYRGATATMVEVIERLMELYRTTEALAELTTEDVLRLFDEAVRHRQAAALVTVPRAI